MANRTPANSINNIFATFNEENDCTRDSNSFSRLLKENLMNEIRENENLLRRRSTGRTFATLQLLRVTDTAIFWIIMKSDILSLIEASLIWKEKLVCVFPHWNRSKVLRALSWKDYELTNWCASLLWRYGYFISFNMHFLYIPSSKQRNAFMICGKLFINSPGKSFLLYIAPW